MREQIERHAVRWAIRNKFLGPDWSKWHITDDGDFTLCGRAIRIFEVDGSPDTDEDFGRADCKYCRSKAGLGA